MKIPDICVTCKYRVNEKLCDKRKIYVWFISDKESCLWREEE